MDIIGPLDGVEQEDDSLEMPITHKIEETQAASDEESEDESEDEDSVPKSKKSPKQRSHGAVGLSLASITYRFRARQLPSLPPLHSSEDARYFHRP